MTRGRVARLARAAAVLALLTACARRPDGPPHPSDEGPGILVEEVAPGSPAADAGVQTGDVLLSWERAPAASEPRAPHAGALRTSFDLHLLEIREGALGPVILHGRRGSGAASFTIRPGAWQLFTRPLAPGTGPLAAAWERYSEARAAARARDWGRADAGFAGAVREAERAADASVLAFLEREAGFALGRQARLAESRRWHERALAHRQGADALEKASSLVDLGITALLLNDLDEAAAQFGRARSLLERAAPRSYVFASTLGLLGLIHEKRGDLAGHEDMERRALALLEGLDPAGRHTAAALHNLGDVLRRRGSLAAAEESYRRSLGIKSRFAPDRSLAYTVMSLGHVERARGNLAGARESYERALELIRAHGPDATAEAALELALGEAALDAGDGRAAAERFRAALETSRRVAAGGAGVTEALGRLGEVARRRGRLAEARALFREALALAETAAPRGPGAARALFHLGEVALDEGQPRQAERLLRRAVSLHERAAPQSSEHAEALHRLALALWRGGRPDEAAPRLARATDILDAAQGRLGGTEEAAARFHARYLKIYRDRMELLLALGRPEAAFEVLERSRAVALRRILRQRDLGAGGGGHVRSPAGAFGEAPALAAAASAAALEPGTLALSFAVGRDATRVFVLRPSAPLRVVTLAAGEDDLRREVERLRLLLAAPGPGAEAREGVISRAEALYRVLLRPLEPQLASAERLLVVPDGPLHLLPFAALVRLDEHGRRRYLAEWKPHHTAASLNAYVLLGRNGTGALPASRELVAFADPWPCPAGHRLGALPGSRGEVEAVAAQFQRTALAFVGESATETRVKALARRAGILHFAVHGIVDDAVPMDSGLVLAAAAGGAEDGFLQAWEIVQGLQLDADLVTLSGCDTGLGAAVPGEGILGLAGAFHYAGARAVLASLWKVSDRSTAELMEGFYRRLALGRPASAALREAQVDLIRGLAEAPPAGPAAASLWDFPWRRGRRRPARPMDTSHPFHWAAFELMGAPR